MSIFNEISDRGQLTRVLQGRLNMTGAAPAPSLMPEIAPTLTLENDRPEWGYLKGEFLYGRGITSPAVAAQSSWSFLRNISGSGVLMVCQEALQVSGQQGAIYVGSTTPTTLSSTVSGNPRDTRNPTQSQGFVGAGANAAVPGGFSLLSFMPSGLPYTQPIVLLPGWWALMVCLTVNTAMNASWSWTERPALPGELV